MLYILGRIHCSGFLSWEKQQPQFTQSDITHSAEPKINNKQNKTGEIWLKENKYKFFIKPLITNHPWPQTTPLITNYPWPQATPLFISHIPGSKQQLWPTSHTPNPHPWSQAIPDHTLDHKAMLFAVLTWWADKQCFVHLSHAFHVDATDLCVVNHRHRVVFAHNALGCLLHWFWSCPWLIDVLGRKKLQSRQVMSAQAKKQLIC